jgi:TRAP-type transport system periplasmic protein
LTKPPEFVSQIKAKTNALEDNWAKAAEAKGLKDAKGVLAELRAEIAKLDK